MLPLPNADRFGMTARILDRHDKFFLNTVPYQLIADQLIADRPNPLSRKGCFVLVIGLAGQQYMRR